MTCGSDELAHRVLMLRRLRFDFTQDALFRILVVCDATVVHHLISLSVIRCRTTDSAFWSPLSGDSRMFSPNFSVHAGWQQGFVKTSVLPRLYRLAQHRQQVVFGRSPKRGRNRARRREILVSWRVLITGCSVFRSSSCIDPLNRG